MDSKRACSVRALRSSRWFVSASQTRTRGGDDAERAGKEKDRPFHAIDIADTLSQTGDLAANVILGGANRGDGGIQTERIRPP